MLLLRKRKPEILRYVADFLSKDKDISDAGHAHDAEHERLRQAIDDVSNQLFVQTATWGLKLWEEVMGITFDFHDSYEVRRNRIYLKLQGNQVSTKKFIVDLINRYTRNNSGFLIEHNEENWFEYGVNIDDVIHWRDLSNAVDTYKPAHLGAYLVLMILQEQKIRQRAEILQIVDTHQNPYNKGIAELVRYNRKHRLNESFYYSGIYPLDAAYRTRQVQHQDCTQSTNCVHIFKPINRIVLNSRCNVNIAYKPSLYAVGSCIADSKQKIKMMPIVKATSVVDCEYTSNDEPRETNAYNRKFAYNGLHTYSKSKISTGLLDNLCTIIITKNGRKVGTERV